MRLFDLLLHLYPASFRREYEAELRHAFAERRREATSLAAMLWLWVETVPEVVGNAAAVHWDILTQDLRFAWRSLARSRGFVVTAVVVMALGVGATAAAFSVSDFVLVRPLPFAHPERLVKVWERLPGYNRLEMSPANFDDWKRMNRSFSSMAAYSAYAANLVTGKEPERVRGAKVTFDLPSTLGVAPILGRGFSAADDRAGAPGTLVLSYAFWRSAFGGEPGVLGRTVRLDGEPYQVIGVMPPDFQFPTRGIQFWTPFRLDKTSPDYLDRTNYWLDVVARLRPGVTLAQARADVEGIAARLEQQYPVANKQTSGVVVALRDDLPQQSRLLLVTLSAAALCILLIACANLGNLLLVRGVARRRELAVRAALGAGRERLVRQMLTEALLLVGLGLAAGTVVGIAGVPVLSRLVPDSLPVAGIPTVDVRVLLFAGALALSTCLAFAIVPVLGVNRRSGLSALREGRGGGGRSERVRAALVAFEMAAAVVLLVSAGLLLRAVERIDAVDPGFRTDGLLTLRTALPYPRYATVASRERFYDQVLSGVRAIPGVTNAAYTSWLPLEFGGGIWPAQMPGQPVDRGASGSASIRYVTPGYFATMGIPRLDGRDVDAHDTQHSTYAAVVSESFAKRYWPNGDAIGQQFTMAFDRREVVGVVADVKVRGLDRTSEPQVYFPATQVGDSSLIFYAPKDLVIRSALPSSALVPRVRRIIRAADPEQPISDVQTMADVVASQTASRAAQLRVLGMLAVLAFLLAGIGIHGVLAFAVSQRAKEIGVRMALGAASGRVVRLVVGQGLMVAAAGVIPGLVVAVAVGRAMRAMLFDVSPVDPLTFAGAVTLTLLMTLVGTLLPARRAARIDPTRALRSE